ncbi:hypothetical protein JOF56_008198 [Kibdelosporangium banguiense]|uniref:Uncharacterized protein n=1 Tax=Kibdelosporangium banguiense TaxID=1365924 RepID=A0ABS4TTU0_9PSEU|nr:hypothetical protein [Kibdelosporangium banguiense]MBP2327813.1 hypothetical protein [Kibdelosporangium banguiense]
MDGDDASPSTAEDLPDRQRERARRSHRTEPDVVVEIEIVDGEDAARLARQQTKAILDILTWQQAQPSSGRHGDPPRTVN